MNRLDWIRDEAHAMDMIARCSEVADTVIDLLERTKEYPNTYRKVLRLAWFVVDVKRAAQSYRDKAGAQINK